MEFQQPTDFLDESTALFALVSELDEEALDEATLFKNWTVNDILQHLHCWNWAARESLSRSDAFSRYMQSALDRIPREGVRPLENDHLDGLSGRALVEAWRDGYAETAEAFIDVDPKMRVRWVGPDMSALSSITARLMETWAHGQAIYDLLSVDRVDHDRIRNIAVLGINTFGWTFDNRKRDRPGEVPSVRLTAPSGEIWTWNDDNPNDRIEGTATEFCQVVTQTRNVADTNLRISGSVARAWMDNAQCFAGPPVQPPDPGFRKKR